MLEKLIAVVIEQADALTVLRAVWARLSTGDRTRFLEEVRLAGLRDLAKRERAQGMRWGR